MYIPYIFLFVKNIHIFKYLDCNFHKMDLNIILAVDKNYGYSYNDNLPWNNKNDMIHFKKTTSNSVLIMGNKTWLSIPNKENFLLNRKCYVLTTKDSPELVSKNQNLYYINNYKDIFRNTEIIDKRIYVIGGKQIWERALNDINLKRIYISTIDGEYKCDKYFKELDNILNYRCDLLTEVRHDDCLIQTYHIHSEEEMYLKLMKRILHTGFEKNDRTRTGTLSTFGTRLQFSLKHGQLPLLTTKRTFWKGILHELIWFLNGKTNANLLKDKNIHIWDGNSSREFLDEHNFNYRDVGDLGPVYGFQWRHWGAKYKDMYSDYGGIDQIKDLIYNIIKNPDSRRHILSAWNVSDLSEMCLPPCHMMCQFYVNDGELSCQMYQRSADMFLGVPFNIASYATLTYIIAHLTNLKPSTLYISFGDTHIYKNHIDAVKTQLTRNPHNFPTLHINHTLTNIDKLSVDDFVLNDYVCNSTISAKMAV